MNGIEQARKAVRQMGVRLVDAGLVIGTWGNTNVRLGDKGVITPRGANLRFSRNLPFRGILRSTGL